MTAPIADLPSRHNGKHYLEAHVRDRGLSRDLVLVWSAKAGPYDLIEPCKWITHAPGHSAALEVIADDEVLHFDTMEDLKRELVDRQLVRFNVNDWSVTWMAGNRRESAEVQAALGQIPKAMTDMVKVSVEGIEPDDVDAFFAELGQAL